MLVEKSKNEKSNAKDLYFCDCKKITSMLYKDKITVNFCIINYILKEIKYTEGFRRKISDSEIITIAFIAATGFYANHCSAIKFVI